MINFGFRISGENDLCKLTSNSLAACQPDAIIPTRSVERRLSSAYCKGYGKNTPECLPPGQEYVPQQQPQKNSGGKRGRPVGWRKDKNDFDV